MAILEFLQGIRCPFLDSIMLAITNLGDETAFLVAALIMFWCVDKRKGYYILTVGFLGTILNQFMKLLFRVPRPWVNNPDLQVVEGAKEGAGGYSFPSGHSQSSVGTFGGVAAVTKNKVIKWLCIAVCILVPFSRMYLGVHTPQDVLVGSAMAVAMIFLMRPLIFGADGKRIPMVLGAMTLIAVAYLCYVEFFPFPADMDAHNVASGTKNAYTLMGALMGFLVVYFVDEKWLHFPVSALWWVQIIKFAVGLVLVLLVKEGLRAPLDILPGEYTGRCVRYFLMVIVAGILWPLSFRRFSMIGKKEQA